MTNLKDELDKLGDVISFSIEKLEKEHNCSIKLDRQNIGTRPVCNFEVKFQIKGSYYDA